MATQTQNTNDNEKAGFKKAFDQTKTQVEKIWNDAFSQFNVRYQSAEKELKELLNKFEEDTKTRFEALVSNLELDKKAKALFDKVKSNELVGQGTKLGEEIIEQSTKLGDEAIEKLGLVRSNELEKLSEQLNKISKKVESIRVKANSAPTKKSITELSKRVKSLEKALKS